MPDWYLDQPGKMRGDDVYLAGFWELSTERSYGQYLGPIPWSKIIFYGERIGLDDTMMAVFTRMIRELDEAFLADQRQNANRRTEQTRPPDPKSEK